MKPKQFNTNLQTLMHNQEKCVKICLLLPPQHLYNYLLATLK